MSFKTEIGGIPVTVVSDDEANLADFVVCALASTPSPFTDNETGTCSKCGAAIIFRPYIPKGPPRICLQCAMIEVEANKAKKPS